MGMSHLLSGFTRHWRYGGYVNMSPLTLMVALRVSCLTFLSATARTASRTGGSPFSPTTRSSERWAFRSTSAVRRIATWSSVRIADRRTRARSRVLIFRRNFTGILPWKWQHLISSHASWCVRRLRYSKYVTLGLYDIPFTNDVRLVMIKHLQKGFLNINIQKLIH